MYCPNCKQTWDGRFCPECGTKLVEEPRPAQDGISVNLGDANAISGGVHVTDSHNVSNIDNSVHNITNTNTTVNNITNVAAQKTESEILQERKIEFMEVVKDVFAGGILEDGEIARLEDERIRIGLDEITAKRLIETARRNVNNVKALSLNPTQVMMMRQIVQLMKDNNVQQLSRQLPRLEAIAKNTIEEEPRFIYNLALAAVNPGKLVEEYEALSADDYWQTYWSYIAYLKLGEFKKAEDVQFALPRYTQYSLENITLLTTVGAMREFGVDNAREYMDTVTGMYSERLNQFASAIYLMIDPAVAAEFGATQENCAFYLNNILQFEDAEARARREAEERMRAEEEANKLLTLNLLNAGANSFKVAMVLKSNMGISLSDAKALVDCAPIPLLRNKTMAEISPLAEMLKTAGAITEIN